MAAATDTRSQLEGISRALREKSARLTAELSCVEIERKAVDKALSALPPKDGGR